MAQRLKASPDVVLQMAGHAKRPSPETDITSRGTGAPHPTIPNDVEACDMGILGMKGKWETLSSEVAGSADGGFWGFSGSRVGGSEEALLGQSAFVSQTEIPATGCLQTIECLSDNVFTLQSFQNSIGTSSMGKGRGVKVKSYLSLDSVFFELDFLWIPTPVRRPRSRMACPRQRPQRRAATTKQKRATTTTTAPTNKTATRLDVFVIDR